MSLKARFKIYNVFIFSVRKCKCRPSICLPEEISYGICLTENFEEGVLCCKERYPNRNRDKKMNKDGKIQGKKKRPIPFPSDNFYKLIRKLNG